MECPSGEWYKTEFNIFDLEGPEYNVMVIPDFSDLTVLKGHKEEIILVNGCVFKLKYPAMVADQDRDRVLVDNNN